MSDIPDNWTAIASQKHQELQRAGMRHVGDVLIDPATGRRATIDYWGRVDWVNDCDLHGEAKLLPTLPSDVGSIIAECHALPLRVGWWSDVETGERINRNKGELLCLVHSEISEGRDADLNVAMDDKLTHRLGAEVELADALIRLGDYLGGFGYPFAPEAIVEIKPVWMSWSGLHSMVSYIMEIERKRTVDDDVMRNYMGGFISEAIGAICAYAKWRDFDIWGAVREKLVYNAQRADHKPENRRQAGGKAW